MLVSISRIEQMIELRPLLRRTLVAIGKIRNGPKRGHEPLHPVVRRRQNHSVSIFSYVHVSTLESKFLRQANRLTPAIHEKTCLSKSAIGVAGGRRIARTSTGFCTTSS